MRVWAKTLAPVHEEMPAAVGPFGLMFPGVSLWGDPGKQNDRKTLVLQV